jgi:hypothetical protein
MTEANPGNGSPLEIQGHLFAESNNGRQVRRLVNTTRVQVDNDRARYEASGVGNDRHAAVESRSPHVRKFLREVDEANRQTSADIVHPFSKDDQVRSSRGVKARRLDPDELVPCPACNGDGWDECVLCGGEGRCPARAARAYREVT